MDKINTTPSPNEEIVSLLPSSLKLMLEIEKQAQAKVAEILRAIDRGETTLEDVIRQRA